MRAERTEGPVNVICIANGNQRYVVLYSDSREGEAMQVLARWAADKRLNLTWHDAARGAQQICQQAANKAIANNGPLHQCEDYLDWLDNRN